VVARKPDTGNRITISITQTRWAAKSMASLRWWVGARQGGTGNRVVGWAGESTMVVATPAALPFATLRAVIAL
jgi:hypothetical protein